MQLHIVVVVQLQLQLRTVYVPGANMASTGEAAVLQQIVNRNHIILNTINNKLMGIAINVNRPQNKNLNMFSKKPHIIMKTRQTNMHNLYQMIILTNQGSRI